MPIPVYPQLDTRYTLPVFKQSPEVAGEVELIQKTLVPWEAFSNGGLGGVAMQAMFGYLSAIFLKTCGPQGESANVDLTITGQGQYIFGATKCTGVLIDITTIPNTIDMKFGTYPMPYAGLCGFMRGNSPKHRGFVRAITRNQDPVPAPRPAEGAPYFVVTRKWATFIVAGIKNSPDVSAKYRYPVQYLNHVSSAFVPPSTAATGFYWSLKPGVVAKLILLGESRPEPVMLANTFGFDPMNGGFYGLDPGPTYQIGTYEPPYV